MARKSTPRTCPDTIRIFGRTYTFSYERAGGLGQDRVGSCDNFHQIITIDDQQSLIEEADTVLHEVFHAIFYTMKIGLDMDTEEKVVSAMATGVVGVLQDNPEFAQWLIENKSAHLQAPNDNSSLP